MQPVAIFRDGWSDARAGFLATKGGRASVSHGHMDAGSFVLDALGRRWAGDLGRPDYEAVESTGFQGLFEGGQDGARWTLLRMHNLAHNTLTLGGRAHRVDGHAPLLGAQPGGVDAPGTASYDLSAPLGLPPGSATRAFAFTPGERVVVRDTLANLTPGEGVRWNLLTPAAVELSGGGRAATLRLGGERLRVRLAGPDAARFATARVGAGEGATAPLRLFGPAPDATFLFADVPAPADGRLELTVEVRWAQPPGACHAS